MSGYQNNGLVGNGECNDGGDNAIFGGEGRGSGCDYGTDCQDCNWRAADSYPLDDSNNGCSGPFGKIRVPAGKTLRLQFRFFSELRRQADP